MARPFANFYYQTNPALGEDGRRITASKTHTELARRAAGDGMVLLENRNGALPLKADERVALIGKGNYDYVRGGGGSGVVYCPYTVTLREALEKKAEENKVVLTAGLTATYDEYIKKEQERIAVEAPKQRLMISRIKENNERFYAEQRWRKNCLIRELDLSEEQIAQAAAQADTAVISIARYSGEGIDRTADPEFADFYLSDVEKRLIERTKKAFKKTVIVLNVGGMVDTEWFVKDEQIDAVLLGWQAGMEGCSAVADILVGDVNPSGKLVDTFADSFDAYPSSANFNESDDYVEYTDDIFVGYRYFETIPGAAARVNYPFGYGLSYTTFALTDVVGRQEGERIALTATVTNTGERAGKEVVQVYASAPQGKLGKAAKVLIGFVKTRLLAPGESQTVAVTLTPDILASFDDIGAVQKSAWVLEKGDYRFFIGTSVREGAYVDYVYTVEQDTVVEQLSAYCQPVKSFPRLQADGSYATVEAGTAGECLPEHEEVSGTAPEDVRGFFRVADGEITLEDFMAQMTDEELVHVVCGQANRGVCNVGTMGAVDRLSIPYVPTTDGPAGVRIIPETGVSTTAFPCSTLLACTWDPTLAYQIGEACGKEVRENNLGIWLAPGMNIHRTPLCGRNFEYLAEDPFVAGTMAAAVVRGAQSQKVAATPKHFCCNNKEGNRHYSDSRLSERALREIYLKGFEICVKTADPWCLMTSYNFVNGRRPSENSEMLEGILRREWGFKGMVMTDWTNYADQCMELTAGNDVHMPRPSCDEAYVLACLQSGKLKRADLQACVKRVLEMILKLA